jgi:hypothetical protein
MKIEVKLTFDLPKEFDSKLDAAQNYIYETLQYAELEMMGSMLPDDLETLSSTDQKALETRLDIFEKALETITVEKIDG